MLSGALTVNVGATLTLAPGTVVKASATSTELVVYGALIADGTPSLPIVFTSHADDTIAGDTNGDGAGSSPAARDWIGIGFGLGSVGNVLDYVEVRYAGELRVDGTAGVFSGGRGCQLFVMAS